MLTVVKKTDDSKVLRDLIKSPQRTKKYRKVYSKITKVEQMTSFASIVYVCTASFPKTVIWDRYLLTKSSIFAILSCKSRNKLLFQSWFLFGNVNSGRNRSIGISKPYCLGFLCICKSLKCWVGIWLKQNYSSDELGLASGVDKKTLWQNPIHSSRETDWDETRLSANSY